MAGIRCELAILPRAVAICGGGAVRRGSAVLATASATHGGRRMRSSVLYLVFNFGASVLIIFVNKSLFSGGLRFESACTLNCG